MSEIHKASTYSQIVLRRFSSKQYSHFETSEYLLYMNRDICEQEHICTFNLLWLQRIIIILHNLLEK